ncbi:hypothetical protein [Rhizobium sp. NZLR11]|uniref:hypothetical protein n=1 Tax=Rhizobium sp. NZLR11 TaxID=2731098 RepID=UPI001C834591|nr:hypothetical protein [Rhizobium sp. NZLR11]MBX5210521.1 hypothetical protein [Rhizobium sp. NZLR11]
MTQVTDGAPAPIVAGKLYALGATVSQNGDIHWVAKGRKGDAALNAYLLTEGKEGLLVDTNYPIIEDALIGQLKTFGLNDLKIVFTRAVEFDSMANADVIVDQFPVSEIWSHFAASDWVYLRTEEPLPVPNYESKMFGADGEVALSGGRVLETINAKLKLLNAAWLYDATSRTLFTSDAFSHVMAPKPGVRVVTEETDSTTADDVTEHLRTKFKWIEGADTEPLREFVQQTFEKYDIEHIAPTIGCAISGRNLVVRHRDFVIDALRKLDGKENLNG